MFHWELDQQVGCAEKVWKDDFIWRWSVSVKDIVPMVVQPGTLARSSRATGERARELRKGDREIWVQELFFQVGEEEIAKGFATNYKPPIIADACVFFIIFLSLRLYRVL